MSDINKVTDFLRSHIREDLLLEFMEKPSPLWDGRCILDMVKEGKTDEVLASLSDALDS